MSSAYKDIVRTDFGVTLCRELDCHALATCADGRCCRCHAKDEQAWDDIYSKRATIREYERGKGRA